MKTLRFTKLTEPAFQVDVVIDIVDSITTMQETGFERMCTIMETKGLTDDAIVQGMDFTKKVEGSYQDILERGRSIGGVKIEVSDNPSTEVETLFTPLVIVATDDSVGDINGATGDDDVLNVLDNDTLDEEAATTETVDLVEISNDSEGALTLNEDGSIDVAAETDPGEYEIVYKISEKDFPGNYDTATATITVV